MDLRTERTRRSIANAFLELRKQKPLEKITVKELAELAYINKATFYTHYHDIYDLSDQLENELLDKIIQEIPHPESIITSPSLATKELAEVMTSPANSDMLYTLFSDSRKGYLSEKLYIAIRKPIDALYPEKKDNLQHNIVLSIIIQGCFHTFQVFDNGANRDEVVRIIGAINDTLKEKFL